MQAHFNTYLPVRKGVFRCFSSLIHVLHAVVAAVADILHDGLTAVGGGSKGGVHPLPDAAVEVDGAVHTLIQAW